MSRVIFKDRDFTQRVQPGIGLEVVRYSAAAVGGPKEATIRMTGDYNSLLEMLYYLRRPVEIYDEQGRRVWWGYVERVEIPFRDGRPLAWVSSLDEMYNRVAVAYTLTSVGEETTGERYTTDWAEDTDSMAEFGTRELLHGMGGTSATVAEKTRDIVLGAYSRPVIGVQRAGSSEAVMTCRGWWWSLEWQYANVPPLLTMQMEAETTEVNLGADDSIDAIGYAQSFQLYANNMNILQVSVRMRAVGTITEGVDVGVYSYIEGTALESSIGTSIVTGAIPGTAIGTAWAWCTCTFSGAELLPGSAKYWFTLENSSGSIDASNYYVLAVDGATNYADGDTLKKVGSDWSANDPDFDITFRMYDNAITPTSQQVYSLITNYGEYLPRVVIENASGIDAESYRNGDSDALYEVEQLLAAGTDNDLRLLSAVDADRTVRIYEQPAATSYYLLDKDGQYWDDTTLIPSSTCPVGVWMRDKERPDVQGSELFNWNATTFIEENEYDAETGRLTPQVRGLLDILADLAGGRELG